VAAYSGLRRRLPGLKCDNALQFWVQQRNSQSDMAVLAEVAEDPLACPALQAYVERIFSVCGLLTSGRRNCMNKSLQMRASLKLNTTILAETGFEI